jgi:hypothetical protein
MELSNPMVFGISKVKPLGSAIREIICKTDLRETGCENVGWMEWAWNCVQWQAFVLAVLNLQVLLTES